MCRFRLFKYISWPHWFAYELSLLQVYTRRHVFFLSIYRFILISFSVNHEWGKLLLKISTNELLST